MTETIRLALATFMVGFVIEAATEIYQFVSFDVDQVGWIGFTYVGLGTTIFGFYVMYRGRHEWTDLHRANVHRGHRLLWAAAAIFGVAVVAIAVLGTVMGSAAATSTPPALAWVIGGLIALAIANFFLGLALLVDRLAGRIGRGSAWAAFGWSLGVAVLTGWVVGSQFSTLLVTFFTAPWRLLTNFGPLTFYLSPLFVTYGLLVLAYFEAHRRVARTPSLAPEGRKQAPSGPAGPPGGPTEPGAGEAPDEARTSATASGAEVLLMP